ncbi:type I pullulanase [Mariniplasma anaerobium]|uniref:pullulanase n=1 Tax=Mariniplasma anaerobium TaxID=2735436 RepID=A0A7U9XVF5_9MOLU|nr:type I pullulanase [Mariniplasma anaerobium]BCR36445.1 type I pullulanase [Mariniplasma anaerobium]
MKRILFLVLFTLSIFVLQISAVAAELPETLVVHYFRYDETYTNFNFWMWESEPSSLGGIQHDFDGLQTDEHGVYYEVDLTADYPTATTLGIIIKQGAWDGYREVGGDRFIDLEDVEVISGIGHVYFVEGDLQIGKSSDDLANNIPDYRAKILSATFDASQKIILKTTHIPELGYEVYENGTLILSSTTTSKTTTITVSGIDISKTYTVKALFSSELSSEVIVSLQNIYDTPAFEELFTYDGTLGVSFEDEFTVFRLWAPLSQSVSLNLYNQGHPNYDNNGDLNDELTPYQTTQMSKIENGAWEIKLTGDYDFKYYTFLVNNNGVTSEVTDPYAYSTGANGQRGMIVNFDQTNPDGWTYDSRPDTIQNLTDYIVYELHVRDLTTHESWNGTESYRGKFMGLTETGTTYSEDGVSVTTGLDHLAELGVNAVQLLPIFDFGYVDEVEVANNPNYQNLFNWGYMPYHFNTLEGSYATNPFDGQVRINEFKQAVMALHDQDIRVIMDVVYNHTGESSTSNFHKIVPGYYHRMIADGGFSNGSGTGNETASERAMMRKFMVDSVEFWATEYNLSGFRFDLMALHDYETMNDIQAMLEEIDPTIIVYGEPWNGGTTPLSDTIAAGKDNIQNMNNVGAFNDITRDAVKGSVFQATEKGWVQGNTSSYNYQGVMYGIVGGIDFPGITEFDEWHLNPNQTINYVSAHDNNTLYDKLKLTRVTTALVDDMQIQANAIILTSQGIPFLHAGVDFMRSKPDGSGGFDHNSYESPDSVNQLRWDRKLKYKEVFEYYKTLIAIRKLYPQFRMNDADDIRANLQFLDTDAGFDGIAYKLTGAANVPDVIVIHSGNPRSILTGVVLDAGVTYNVLTNTDQANIDGLETISGSAYVAANTTMILVENTGDAVSIKEDSVTISKGDTFDPASNVNILDENATIYYSNYFDTSKPGRYTVTVAVADPYKGYKLYYYTLFVEGQKYDVVLTDLGGE